MSKVKKKAAVIPAKPAAAGQHTPKAATAPAHHHRPAHKAEHESYFVFGKANYMIMGVGVIMLLFGYAIMWGGGTDPNHPEIFDAAAKYSFTRITLSPIIIILGLIVEIFAIMYKPKAPSQKIEHPAA